ncbi:hypothetical protein AGMMS49546_32530 [Spirochaetia bacterium]|nr:hypothetical protein AGMMS49546_32530 [Spirochaetia bacterium]
MAKRLTESVLEELLDYYGNFTGDPRFTGMITAAGKAAGISPQAPQSIPFVRALADEELNIAAAGDANQSRSETKFRTAGEAPTEFQGEK